MIITAIHSKCCSDFVFSWLNRTNGGTRKKKVVFIRENTGVSIYVYSKKRYGKHEEKKMLRIAQLNEFDEELFENKPERVSERDKEKRTGM